MVPDEAQLCVVDEFGLATRHQPASAPKLGWRAKYSTKAGKSGGCAFLKELRFEAETQQLNKSDLDVHHKPLTAPVPAPRLHHPQ